MRLDLFCVQQGWFYSRNKAQEAIQKGIVLVDDCAVLKSSFEVLENTKVKLKQEKCFVSRAGEKLWNFLENNPIEITNSVVLDIGSSTGGFTQVMLQKGAKEVYCVDVGKNQLHKDLREDSRIHLFEEMDIRQFTPKEKDKIFDIIVCDVSFIPIQKIFYSFENRIGDWLILLFKPQFEVGKEAKRNKKGVVLDEKKIQEALWQTIIFLEKQELKVIKYEESSVRGKEGNIEFFIACQRERKS
ncbi:TlyA family RNA methyltransferase [Helicobacter canadensis]|uniref:Predicted rRNA methylase n=1 Tax=Helicobacter canadensis MIT 98-5491 TaxID=537970 RepID=C5ZX87_9HELI|nr:TlyA family RNA methyltransferase [Helicobacter canadensis]EES89755.1 predicted rRNA methylase [Helicobacter canadensis MIT 98-5491]EFR48549.1 putative ribosomal RNA large subunit methyltransferase J [Helicobacter canadensis MIT 98-5491]STO99793.1 RNA binding methyltransferase FtsJ like [Helicobacter canadensis]